MKKGRRKQADRQGNAASRPEAPRKPRPLKLAVIVLGAIAVVAVAKFAWRPHERTPAPPDVFVPRPQGTVTFNRNIAPIIFRQCSPCHRPGQAAPFSLLSHADVKKKAREIADVIESRYMPPWLPEPGHGHFDGERRLSRDEIGLIKQWIAEGMAEGNPADLPSPPQWPEGWAVGKPDLVLTLPSPYSLAPEGKDVYRNFVVPIPTGERRYVRAVEFHPDNHKVIHHAFIEVDETRQSRNLTDSVKPPGFDGMQLPESVQMPGGQMLGWQPGKRPYVSPNGLSWVLEPNSDLVLQLHLHPSGTIETVAPSVGFFFTDTPPTNTAFRINLCRYTIDIPAGSKDYWIENRYELPIDVDLLAITPHTHYLGKELQGYALLPDGSKKWLILIKNWDFNWQGDYRYAEPVFLPKGTTLVMHFSYDNSAENIHNPSHPPKRVKYGLQTTDEMGELWFQVLPRNVAEREKLANDFFIKLTRDAVEENESLLRADPQDPEAHLRLGNALFFLRRIDDAVTHLREAVRLRPDNDQAHSCLGGIYLGQGRLADAKAEYEAVLRLRPNDYQACGSLGFIFMREGDPRRAESYLENALSINPGDPISRALLGQLRNAKDGQPNRN